MSINYEGFAKVIDYNKIYGSGETGPAGLGISFSTIDYQIGINSTTAPAGDWEENEPDLTSHKGKYLWTRIIFTYTDGSDSNPIYSVTYIPKDGEDGLPGAPGEDGRDGIDGKDGSDGSDGIDGRSITAITPQWLVSPYNSEITNEDDEEWSETPLPVNSTDKYLWRYEIITWDKGVSPTKTEPYIVKEYVEDGSDAKLIRLLADSIIVKVDKNGLFSPAKINLTVEVQNLAGALEWKIDNVVQSETNPSYELNTSLIVGDSTKIRVTIGSHYDEVTIYKIYESEDALTVILSNEQHILPTSETRVDYSNSECEISAYYGLEELVYTASEPLNVGEFTIRDITYTPSPANLVVLISKIGKKAVVVIDEANTTLGIGSEKATVSFIVRVKVRDQGSEDFVKRISYVTSLDSSLIDTFRETYVLQETLKDLVTTIVGEELIEGFETIEERFSSLEQNSRNIQMNFSHLGGSNLIQNSVGYAHEGYDFSFWVPSEENLTSFSFSLEGALSNYRAGGGWKFSAPESQDPVHLEQPIYLTPSRYTLSFIAPNSAVAINDFIHIDVLNSAGEVSLLEDRLPMLVNNEGFLLKDAFSTSFTIEEGQSVLIRLTIDPGSFQEVYLTDLMLTSGEREFAPWEQAAKELYSSNILFDANGITTRGGNSNNLYYTKMTPHSFSGHYNKEEIFTLNKDGTRIKSLEIHGDGVQIAPMKLVQSPEKLSFVWIGYMEENNG